MHFNDDELSLAALAPQYQFTKEGVLFTKPLKKSQKKTKSAKVKNGTCSVYCYYICLDAYCMLGEQWPCFHFGES